LFRRVPLPFDGRSSGCRSSGSILTRIHTAVAVSADEKVVVHNPNLVEVSVEDFSRGLRLLSDRRGQLVASRTQTITRLHGLLAELVEGGAPQSLTADKAAVILRRIRPVSDVDDIRKELARELLEDIKRLDSRVVANAARIADAVAASGTTLTGISGIGPITAAKIIGHSGVIGRFPDRGHYASYAGTAPIEASSGDVQRHRLSRRGNRHLNSALHGVAITQMRHPGPGRDLYDRKIAEGKTRGEARPALKRHLSDKVFATLVADAQRSPGRQVGATHESSAAGQTPTANTSERSVPGLQDHATTDAA
jgi:transposase